MIALLLQISPDLGHGTSAPTLLRCIILVVETKGVEVKDVKRSTEVAAAVAVVVVTIDSNLVAVHLYQCLFSACTSTTINY